MKNLFLSSLLLLILTLASTPAYAQGKTKAATAYQNLWEQIINQGRLDLINAENFSPNVVMVNGPETVSGLDDFRSHYEGLLGAFSDVRFTFVDVFGQGDKVVKHWRFQGKHTADFFGLPPTDREVDLPGVTIATVKNGKVVREEEFYDNHAFMVQLGLASEPGNMAVVQGIYDAFATGDMDSFFGALHEEVVWNEAEGNPLADQNPYVGHEAVLQGVFVRLMADHEYFNVKDVSLHEVSGNKVLATGRYDAKVKGSDTLVDCQMAHLWTLEDGKVVAFQQYADTRQLAEAVSKR